MPGVAGAPNLSVVDAITQFVGGTQPQWNTITIPIPLGLVVYAIDTTAVKMGDGVTLYAELPILFTLSSIITLTEQVAALTADLALLATSTSENTLATEVAGIQASLTALIAEVNGIIAADLTFASAAALAALQTQVNNLDIPTIPPAPTTIATPPAGDNSLDIINSNFLFRAVMQELSIDLTGQTEVTLTQNQWGCGFLSLGGALTEPCTVVFPGAGRWVVSNETSGEFLVICKTINQSEGGTPLGILIPPTGIVEIIGAGIGVVQTNSSVRIKLTAATTFYINAAVGNDTTGTGDVAAPWATIQAAINAVNNGYDTGGANITFACSGNFTTGGYIGMPFVGQTAVSDIVFDGGGTAQVNVVTNTCFSAGQGAQFTVYNFAQLSTSGGTTNGTGYCLGVNQGQIRHSGNNFGSCVNAHCGISGSGGIIFAVGDYSISGSAVHGHLYASENGYIYLSDVAITINDTPDFPNGFVLVGDGGVVVSGASWSGATTGPRYSLLGGGIIQTEGAGVDYFPGDVAGNTDGTGVYQ